MYRKMTPQNGGLVLMIHNVLWSHYKAVVFSELWKCTKGANFRLSIVHISDTEGKRSAVDERTRALHDYPHEVLFRGPRENHSSLKVFLRVARLVWRRKPSVIVVPGYADVASWASLIVGRLRGAKIIIAVDSTRNDKRRFAVFEWVKKGFIGCCQFAFVYGSRAAQYCRDLGMSEDQIFVRCQATDNGFVASEVARYRDSLEDVRAAAQVPWKHSILLLGRLAAEKNFSLVIRALELVMQRNPALVREWGLLIVGHGPEWQSLSTLAQSAGVPVRLFGGVAWWDVPRFLSMAEIMVLPSLSEPWGLVVNEAMAAGVVPVVSDRCGCAPDLIRHGNTGFVFNPLDHEQLAGVLESLMNDPELRAEIKGAAAAHIEQFSPSAAAHHMATGMERALGREAR